MMYALKDWFGYQEVALLHLMTTEIETKIKDGYLK